MENQKCTWDYDDHHFKWDTDCGEGFQFTDDVITPKDHGFEYCPFCGNELTIERD